MPNERSIAIVDNNEAVSESLAALLRSTGYPVMTFATGEEFLATDFTVFGCAVIDVRMPGPGGLEVLEHMASSGTALPIVMISGHGDIPMAVKALRIGAVDFIEKPFTDTVILDSIQRALERKSGKALDETMARDIMERASQLTARERQVLNHLISGKSNKGVAIELGISPRTVEIHRARVMQKMQARNLADLVRMALAGKLDSGSDPAPDRRAIVPWRRSGNEPPAPAPVST